MIAGRRVTLLVTGLLAAGQLAIAAALGGMTLTYLATPGSGFGDPAPPRRWRDWPDRAAVHLRLVGQGRRVTVCFDRGGWSPALFADTGTRPTPAVDRRRPPHLQVGGTTSGAPGLG